MLRNPKLEKNGKKHCNQKKENKIQHPAPISRLKTIKKRTFLSFLKKQHAKLRSRNPGPRSNETNGPWHLSNAPQVKRFICVVHALCPLCLQTICMVLRHVLGQQLRLLLFYLQCPPPVCLVCCIPWFQIIFAAFLSLVSPTYLRALPPKVGQNLHVIACITFQSPGPHHLFTWLQTSVWIDFATKFAPWKETTQPNNYKKGKGDPASTP